MNARQRTLLHGLRIEIGKNLHLDTSTVQQVFGMEADMLTEESQMVTCWPSGAGRDSSIESRFFARGNRWRAASATSWPAKCCAARPSTVDARPRTSTHPGQTSGTSSVSDSLGATKPFVPRIVFFFLFPATGFGTELLVATTFEKNCAPYMQPYGIHRVTQGTYTIRSRVYTGLVTGLHLAPKVSGNSSPLGSPGHWVYWFFPGFEYRVLQFQNVEASLPQVACLTKPTHREGPV